MNRPLLLTLALVAVTGIAAVVAEPLAPEKPAAVAPAPPAQQAQAATVELVFVLDTTGSMGGLLAGAKDTIWSVVNDFASQKPRPHVRVGLVAYRDRGDEYVTRATLLTDDLDQVYMDLSALVADGGGDTPESVGAGLRVAVDDMPWTRNQDRVYRAVYLVGDAPDKGYGGETSPETIAAGAQVAGIHVSAIQCGASGDTAAQFAAIATAGSGAFTAVAQNGAVRRVETPLDARLDMLEQQLAATAMPYGGAAEKAQVQAKIDASRGSSRGVKAARLSVLSKTGGQAVTGEGDLVGAIGSGKVALASVPEAELPDALQALSVSEREEAVAEQLATRGEVQSEIDQLVAERDAWLAAERAKPRSGSAPAYDRSVVEGTIAELRALAYVE